MIENIDHGHQNLRTSSLFETLEQRLPGDDLDLDNIRHVSNKAIDQKVFKLEKKEPKEERKEINFRDSEIAAFIPNIEVLQESNKRAKGNQPQKDGRTNSHHLMGVTPAEKTRMSFVK